MDDLKNQMPLATEALCKSYGTPALLPIEFFKLHAEALRNLICEPIARSFLSSGTTRADRSQSHFSEAGLAEYRKNSLAVFQNVLQHFFTHPLKIPGLSLIPKVETWPDSSLAQMVQWISEEQELHYWNESDPLPNGPLWVFGTAFHFVNLADDGVRLQLPKGSVVIETGGTKGRSRSVTRDELYGLITEHLGVTRNYIISEYGMCELASQAYDFVPEPHGLELPLDQRWFRFPAQIPVSVFDRLSQAQKTGEGTLVVHDTWRIDYPWPIRTEDMARVREDGAFQLLGRVPMSPLKGCSMLAEEIALDGPNMQKLFDSPQRAPIPCLDRALRVHQIAQNLLQDHEFWNLWQQELYYSQAAVWLRDDFKQSLPLTANDWLKAAELARGSQGLARWLIIPPKSHSYAWLYPILLGTVLGLEMHLRVKTQDPLALRVKNLLEPLGGFAIWDSAHRIGVDPMPAVDAVMLFGSDETVKAVQAICPVPIHGFGSSLTISLMHAQGDIQKLWKDAFSLLQKGCMSSRVLFILQDEAFERQQEGFLQALHQAPQPAGPLPLGLELALEHAAFGLRCQGRIVRPRPMTGTPLLVTYFFDPEKNLADLLLDRAMSLSLVLIPKNLWKKFAQWLPEQKNLHKIAIHGKDSLPLTLDKTRFDCVEAGLANAPAWDGRHQNRPLFSLG